MFAWEAIDPESLRLHSLLSGSFYVIPPNQREFKWEAHDQISKLWEDLENCVNSDFPAKPALPSLGHFLGTVVVIGEKQSTAETRQEVIDGQQRLTTISILARVLLDFVDDELLPSSIRQTSILKLVPFLYEDIGGRKYPRLILNREDAFFRNSTIEQTQTKDREQYWVNEKIGDRNYKQSAVRTRIVGAFRDLNAKLKEKLEASGNKGDNPRSQLLENYISALCDNFYVLKLRVQDTRMAYRLFETLNERGLDLSQADLVRNVILEQAASAGETVFQKTSSSWEKMLDSFDEQDPELLKKVPELLQHSYSSRYPSVKAERLFDEIAKKLRDCVLKPDLLATCFEEDAKYWSNFLAGSTKWTDQAKDSHLFITHIKPLWKRHCVPLLLRIMERFGKKPLELGKALWAVECYLLREGTINNSTITKLEKDLSEAARRVGDSSKPDSSFVTLLASRSSDTEFRSNFSVATAKTNLAFYIAWRIEKFKLGGGGYDLSSIRPAKQSPSQHLEHIMPKKPDSSWKGIEARDGFKDYLDRLEGIQITV